MKTESKQIEELVNKVISSLRKEPLFWHLDYDADLKDQFLSFNSETVQILFKIEENGVSIEDLSVGEFSVSLGEEEKKHLSFAVRDFYEDYKEQVKKETKIAYEKALIKALQSL
jgi:hypothetical protein